jgi:hypothetical protein
MNAIPATHIRWLVAAASLAAIIALGLIAAGGRASASHDAIACNDDVPSGYSCVPLVNKPDSGPGIGSPAVGELFYQFVDADTLRVAVRALSGQGAVESGEQFCIDDDGDPYNTPGSGGNAAHNCQGEGDGAVNVTDGTLGLPNASAEPDGAGQYEVRVTGLTADGTVGALDYFELNNVDGYQYYVYHVNIGQSSTQAFFTFVAPTPTSTTPTPTQPTPTTAPGDVTPTPTTLGVGTGPVALPNTGGNAGGRATGVGLLTAVAAGAALALAATGMTTAAVRIKRDE